MRNPKGRPKGRLPTQVAREKLEEVIDAETGRTRLDQMVDDWLENAIVTPSLFLALLDRLEGKVPSSLDLTTKGESMNGDVHLQGVEHRVAALLDKLQKRMNDSK